MARRRAGSQSADDGPACRAVTAHSSSGWMMMRDSVAILCSGQGGQHPGMFDLFAGDPEAEPIFAAASELLGQDPRRFVREAGPEDFRGSGRANPLLHAGPGRLGRAGNRPTTHAVIAGYSVGELAAWDVAGALDVPTTLRLVEVEQRSWMPPRRGERSRGIVGLSRPILEPILLRHSTFLAIVNGTDSFVIGGRARGWTHPAGRRPRAGRLAP